WRFIPGCHVLDRRPTAIRKATDDPPPSHPFDKTFALFPGAATRMNRVLPAGKLPPDLLAKLLATIPDDPSIVVGAGVGRDAAAVRHGDRILVLKSDPITFATDEIGWYAPNVNANDIACMGATPRWMLSTALLPEGSTTPALIEKIFSSLR